MINNTINIAIVGMGKGGQALLKMFADEEAINIQGVVEKNVDAPGVATAIDLGIPVYDEWNVLLANAGLEYIIDVTGNAGVHEDLLRDVPRGIDVMSGPSARLIWLLVEARHRAQIQLEEEKNLSEGLFEGVANGLVLLNMKKEIVKINRAALDMLGFERDDVIGQTCHEIFCPAENDKCPILDLGQNIEKSDRVAVHSDGHKIPILKTVARIKQDGGEYLLESFIDIADRKKAEESLKKQVAFTNEVIEAISNPFCVVDANSYKIMMSNSAAHKQTTEGVTTCHQMTHGCDKPCSGEHVCPVKEVKRTKKPAVVQHVHRDSKGEEKICEVHGYPIFDDEGNVIQMIEWSVDITDRLNAEERIRKLSTAVEQSPSVIAITDLEGKLEYVNKKFTELTGYSKEEVIGENPRVLKSGEQPDEQYKELWEKIVSGEKWMGELCNKKKNGDLYWEYAAISPIFDEQGSAISYMKVAEDITDRKKAEEDLKAVNEELEAFTYTASHDLKEPLRSLETFSQFLIEDYADNLDDEGKDYLKRIAAGAVRMRNLIDDLLALSRVSRIHNPYESVDSETLVKDVVKRLKAGLDEKEAEVTIDDELPHVYCDSTKMKEVFYNLIANAMKYSNGSKPKIEVGAKDAETFFVKDNGKGIDEKYLNLIFQPFRRGADAKKSDGGSGVGLALVKKIVEEHGGKIWVESEVDKGSTFYFNVPRHKEVSDEKRTQTN